MARKATAAANPRDPARRAAPKGHRERSFEGVWQRCLYIDVVCTLIADQKVLVPDDDEETAKFLQFWPVNCGLRYWVTFGGNLKK